MISSLKFEYTGHVMSGQELGFYAKLIFFLMISMPMWKWVMSGLKLGHFDKLMENFVNIVEAAFLVKVMFCQN